MLEEHTIIGGAPAIAVIAVVVLLAGLKSAFAALTVAVLRITALPFARAFTVVTSRTVADAPAGRAPKVTRRSFPEPKQSPLPVVSQEMNVTESGRLSEIVTLVAVTAL